MKLQEFKQEWNNIEKMKLFEIEVTDKRNGEVDYIIFDISIQGRRFVAQHVGMSAKQDRSKKIAFVDWKIDTDFSLDENLQTLHELCLNAIIDSEYFRLN